MLQYVFKRFLLSMSFFFFWKSFEISLSPWVLLLTVIIARSSLLLMLDIFESVVSTVVVKELSLVF